VWCARPTDLHAQQHDVDGVLHGAVEVGVVRRDVDLEAHAAVRLHGSVARDATHDLEQQTRLGVHAQREAAHAHVRVGQRVARKGVARQRRAALHAHQQLRHRRRRQRHERRAEQALSEHALVGLWRLLLLLLLLLLRRRQRLDEAHVRAPALVAVDLARAVAAVLGGADEHGLEQRVRHAHVVRRRAVPRRDVRHHVDHHVRRPHGLGVVQEAHQAFPGASRPQNRDQKAAHGASHRGQDAGSPGAARPEHLDPELVCMDTTFSSTNTFTTGPRGARVRPARRRRARATCGVPDVPCVCVFSVKK
jgi:hypothetical protein